MGKRLVCLGDSITEGIGDAKSIGWPGRLQTNLSESKGLGVWSVLNLGVAGDTSIDIKHRLLSEVLYREPERLIIAAGVNDTAHRLWPDDGGVKIALNHARTIWMDMFQILNGLGIKTAVVSLLPVDEKKLPLAYMPFDENDHGNSFLNSEIYVYNQYVREITESQGGVWLNVAQKWEGRPLDKLLFDGLHPNADGYDLLAIDIMQELSAQKFMD